MVPTFRPDRYLEPASPTWLADVDRLGEVADTEVGDLERFLAALPTGGSTSGPTVRCRPTTATPPPDPPGPGARGLSGRAARALRQSRVRHQLSQIAANGSTKIVVRILPTLLAERSTGRVPVGAATAVAAWTLHLRGLGAPVKDPNAEPALPAAALPELTDAAAASLDVLSPGLGSDLDLVAAVVAQAGRLTA